MRQNPQMLSGNGVHYGAMEGARWYVAQTQSFAEPRAAGHLERQGYHVFYPRFRKVVRHARKRSITLAPLFPGYLFLRLDMSRDRWRSINGTRGVTRLIMQGDLPQRVPRGIVETLQSRVSADGVIDWAPSFVVGQTVRIVDGPLEDFVGTLECLDAAGRVRVLLDLLGRSVTVTMEQEAITSAA